MSGWKQLKTITLSTGVYLASSAGDADDPAPAPAGFLFGAGANQLPVVPERGGAPPQIMLRVSSTGGVTDVRRADETTAGGGSAVVSLFAVPDGEEREDGRPRDGRDFYASGAINVGGTSAKITALIRGAWGPAS